MTLLETAQSLRVQRRKRRRYQSRFNQDELAELALAWAQDEITFGQCSFALYGDAAKGRNVYNSLAVGLRLAHRKTNNPNQ